MSLYGTLRAGTAGTASSSSRKVEVVVIRKRDFRTCVSLQRWANVEAFLGGTYWIIRRAQAQ